MEDKNISPEESLQIIEKMLADTRNRFYNNGFAFLFWGILIIASVVVDYCVYQCFHKSYSAYIWTGATLAGIVFTFVYYALIAAKKRAYSKLDSINGRLWISFMASYIVLTILCAKYNVAQPPFIYCLLGLCVFASGGIYRFWSLYAGAVVFWIGAVLWIFCNTNFGQTLLTVLVMFLGYLVPGYLLWKKAKKEARV